MAVDGWAPDGTPRLICLDPPGGDGSVSNFVPNVFLGYPWPLVQPASPAMPSITPGTSDFSLELWARRKLGNSPGEDEQFWSGILENNSGNGFPSPIACIRWTTSVDDISGVFDALGTGAPSSITAFAAPRRLGLWSHYALNFDRDGNMEIFIDAESRVTKDISAQGDSVVGEVHALTSSHTFVHHNSTFASWSAVSVFPVMVGPFAIHNRLMTNAEIQDSFRNYKVQNISSVSLINFDWRKIEDETGWDLDWDNMMLGHKAGLSVPAAAPQGAVGTVTVRDQSGNGNHWALQTVADYTTYDSTGFSDAEDGKWPFSLGADPFFR